MKLAVKCHDYCGVMVQFQQMAFHLLLKAHRNSNVKNLIFHHIIKLGKYAYNSTRYTYSVLCVHIQQDQSDHVYHKKPRVHIQKGRNTGCPATGCVKRLLK